MKRQPSIAGASPPVTKCRFAKRNAFPTIQHRRFGITAFDRSFNGFEVTLAAALLHSGLVSSEGRGGLTAGGGQWRGNTSHL